MLRNYLTIAFRNLKKYKIFSALNILGLALGISCVVFIYSFISHELSYDKCYPKADRLYRITHTSIEENITRYWAPTAGCRCRLHARRRFAPRSKWRCSRGRSWSLRCPCLGLFRPRVRPADIAASSKRRRSARRFDSPKYPGLRQSS